MPTLSQAQIAMVARSAGLPGDPEVWAAVAMAESSGNTTNRNPSSGAYGLWQIHPIHRKAHPTWTEAWLSDPVNNAKAAKVIHRQQGWGAWEAYTGPDGTGSDGPWRTYYQKGSPNSVQPAGWWDDFWKSFGEGFDTGPGPEDLFDGGTGNDPSITGGLEDVGEGIGAVAEAVQKAGAWMSKSTNWVRVGYVVGGGLLLLVGAYIVAAPLIGKAAASSPVGQAARKVAGAARSSRKKTAAAPAAKTTKAEESSDE